MLDFFFYFARQCFQNEVGINQQMLVKSSEYIHMSKISSKIQIIISIPIKNTDNKLFGAYQVFYAMCNINLYL